MWGQQCCPPHRYRRTPAISPVYTIRNGLGVKHFVRPGAMLHSSGGFWLSDRVYWKSRTILSVICQQCKCQRFQSMRNGHPRLGWLGAPWHHGDPVKRRQEGWSQKTDGSRGWGGERMATGWSQKPAGTSRYWKRQDSPQHPRGNKALEVHFSHIGCRLQ